MKPILTASPQTPQGHGAGVLLFCPGTGRFLFIQRSGTGDGEGTWCCPGGTVEDHETIDEAVRRECEEEIGYRPEGDLLHMHRNVNPDTNYTFHNHMCIVPDEFEPTLNEEHTAYQWSEEAPDNLLPGFQQSMEQWQGRQG